jgi:hypothetical protein
MFTKRKLDIFRYKICVFGLIYDNLNKDFSTKFLDRNDHFCLSREKLLIFFLNINLQFFELLERIRKSTRIVSLACGRKLCSQREILLKVS